MAQWFYSNDGGTHSGPVSLEALQQLIRNGSLNSSSLVWKEGQPQWVYASTVEELFPQYDGAAVAPQAVSTPQYASASPVSYTSPSLSPYPSAAGSSIQDAQPVSFWDWFWLILVFNLPVVGLIAVIIFAISSDNPSLKNYSRAWLLWAGIVVGLFFIVGVFVAIFGAATVGSVGGQ